jgi:small-conductance mechanosensitive channel
MFWHGPTIQDRWKARTAVSLAVDRATRENGIQIPFPQRVLHRAEPSE